MFYRTILLLKLINNSLSLSLFGIFALIAMTPTCGAQTTNALPEERWTGVWVDSSSGQRGNIDIIINSSNGNMSGAITDGNMRGTWTDNIYRNGAIKANYEYAGQPYNYTAQGACQLTNTGQLVARMDFIFQNQKIGQGLFALARANATDATSPAPPDNSGLAKALENKPVGNPDLLKNGMPT